MIRSEEKIQMAHDILWAVHRGEVTIPLDSESKRAIHTALDVLCWVLKHEHNTSFADNLFLLSEAISDAGYVLRKYGGTNETDRAE